MEVPELQLTTDDCNELGVVAGSAGHHFIQSTLLVQRHQTVLSRHRQALLQVAVLLRKDLRPSRSPRPEKSGPLRLCLLQQ